MGWASMRDRMLNHTVATFKDGTATYVGLGGVTPVAGVSVIIDRDLIQSGAEGMFRSDAVGLSWRKPELAAVARGGVFTVGAESFTVEDIIIDDGHMMTAACMVTT